MPAHHSHFPHKHDGYMSLVIIVFITVVIGLVFVWNGNPRQSSTDSSHTVFVPDTRSSETSATNAWAAGVVEDATISSTISIRNCQATPDISQFQMGSRVTFVNQDKQPHVISFGPDVHFVIAADAKLPVSFTFWKTPGIRPFACDDVEKAGIVYITTP